jgi:hypothetical protein
VINVMFNTVKPLSIVSERIAKNKCAKVTYFELFGENVMKIMTKEQIFSIKL